MAELTKVPGFAGSGNAKLSALRVSNEAEFFLQWVTKAITLNDGILSNAALAVDVHRNTMMRWINHYEVLQKVLNNARLEANRK